MRIPATTLGAARISTGSRPTEYMASICSETSIVPISAVIRAPTRPTRTTAVSTGPISSTMLSTTMLPMT